jgi:site-specific recombinase XerD
MFITKASKEFAQWYQVSSRRDRIDLIAKSLIKQQYLDVIVDEHVREWVRFVKYCDDRGIDIPSHIYAQEIADYIRRRFPKGSASRRRFIWASIRIFIEADDEGHFSRRIRPAPKLRTQLFQEWIPPYLLFLSRHRGVSENTIAKNTFALGMFTDFLDRTGVVDLGNLTAKHIHDFCLNPDSRKPMTRTSYLGMIRRFLKYMFSQGRLERDLSSAIVPAKHYRHGGLHDVLTETEFNKLLGSLDRSSALGRRDTAIILLAARYGIRPSDILRLCLEDIQWRQSRVVFTQSKTGRELTLPLLPDVSKALVDYLRNGRPQTQVRNVFVRHIAPFGPFVPSDNLFHIMTKALRRAGLDQRPGRRGLYLLRHTLATRMLSANISIKMIADLLGHASTDSAFGYTKIDWPRLRSVALSIGEVLQ